MVAYCLASRWLAPVGAEASGFASNPDFEYSLGQTAQSERIAQEGQNYWDANLFNGAIADNAIL